MGRTWNIRLEGKIMERSNDKLDGEERFGQREMMETFEKRGKYVN